MTPEDTDPNPTSAQLGPLEVDNDIDDADSAIGDDD